MFPPLYNVATSSASSPAAPLSLLAHRAGRPRRVRRESSVSDSTIPADVSYASRAQPKADCGDVEADRTLLVRRGRNGCQRGSELLASVEHVPPVCHPALSSVQCCSSVGRRRPPCVYSSAASACTCLKGFGPVQAPAFQRDLFDLREDCYVSGAELGPVTYLLGARAAEGRPPTPRPFAASRPCEYQRYPPHTPARALKASAPSRGYRSWKSRRRRARRPAHMLRAGGSPPWSSRHRCPRRRRPPAPRGLEPNLLRRGPAAPCSEAWINQPRSICGWWW